MEKTTQHLSQLRKRETSIKIKLGLFISLGIIIFITAVYYVGNHRNMFGTTFRLSGIFDNVNGLQVGNNVRFSGINVGTVDNIKIIGNSRVKVDFIIEEKVRGFIKKDAVAIIGSEGLMGDKIVNITTGSREAETIENNDFILTVKPVAIEDILKSIKTTTDNAALITVDMARISSTISEGKGTVGTLMMDTFLVVNLKKSILNFKQSITIIAGDLEGIVHKINTGQGAVGTLLMDTVFGNNLKESMASLQKSMLNMEETMVNIKQGSKGFDQNMEALKHSFLLKGYFKNIKTENDTTEEQ